MIWEISALILAVFAGFLYLFYFGKSASPPRKLVNAPVSKSQDSPDSQNELVRLMTRANAKLLIFYGSQTGTAEEYAHRIRKEASLYGLRAVVADLMDHDLSTLNTFAEAGQYLVVFVLATYGDGEPTDNAQDFNDLLKDASDSFDFLNFAVFGLGNKTYTQFNAFARFVHKRLLEFGAHSIHALGEGDDNDNLEDDYMLWKDGFWSSVCSYFGLDAASISQNMRPCRSFEFRVLDVAKTVFYGEHGSINAWNGKQKRVAYDAKFPYYCPIGSSRELYSSQVTDGRSCLHVEFDITGSNMRYQSGDHVAIYPENDPDEVLLLARALGIEKTLDTVFEMRSTDNFGPISKRTPFPCPTTFRAALTHYLDIAQLPKMHILATLAPFATEEAERANLRKLSSTSAESKDAYHSYILDPCRNLRQVLEDHRSVKFVVSVDKQEVSDDVLTLGDLFEMLPKLQPRYYSISSSPREHPNSIHVAAAIVKYETLSNPPRTVNGVATGYLARHIMKRDEDPAKIIRSPIFLRQSSFKLPRNALVPVLLIGPGTGLAPLRAFIQERRALFRTKVGDLAAKKGVSLPEGFSYWGGDIKAESSSGSLVMKRRPCLNPGLDSGVGDKIIGETLLFFGCRDRKQDFIYDSELFNQHSDKLLLKGAAELDETVAAEFLHEGVTSLYAAFSRESSQKSYVQHLLAKQGMDVWRVLSSGGHVFVCGDAKGMAKEVWKAMVSVVSEQGKMDLAAADAYMSTLRTSKRYLEDVWS